MKILGVIAALAAATFISAPQAQATTICNDQGCVDCGAGLGFQCLTPGNAITIPNRPMPPDAGNWGGCRLFPLSYDCQHGGY